MLEQRFSSALWENLFRLPVAQDFFSCLYAAFPTYAAIGLLALQSASFPASLQKSSLSLGAVAGFSRAASRVRGLS
ncbi:MAG: hypothetical protein OXN84_17050 [Albidovulum sp.]|nr:hypothetical protein [Albidovulum sp.]